MSDCKHKFVKEIEGYIPNYSYPSITAGYSALVKIKEWECLICGARLGYLNDTQIVINPDCLKSWR